MRRLPWIVLIAALLALSNGHQTPRPEIHVQDNQLVNGAGEALRLFGVNRSGTEYTCVIGGGVGAGIFSGPSDDASIAIMASWHINAVRIPLNEDCWLAINGVRSAYSGTKYRDAIVGYARRLNDAGMIAVLDLHWNAPGTLLSLGQQVMADADHAPAFWSSVAETFKDNPGVIFDLYNEPTDISWTCWRSGCRTKDGWQTAGMQSLIDAVRQTGAEQPIIAAGIKSANDLSGWRSHPLQDPRHQLVAGIHVYNEGPPDYCNTVACWDRTLAPVAETVPVVTCELGEFDHGTDFLTAYMTWADVQSRAHRAVSILGWSWDPALGEGGPSLVTSNDGTPTAFGRGFRAYLQSLFERGEIHRS